MNKRKTINYINIITKDDKEDFRAFVICTDSTGEQWELRAYGKSPKEAAQQAWERFNEDESQWSNYGYPIQSTQTTVEAAQYLADNGYTITAWPLTEPKPNCYQLQHLNYNIDKELGFTPNGKPHLFENIPYNDAVILAAKELKNALNESAQTK